MGRVCLHLGPPEQWEPGPQVERKEPVSVRSGCYDKITVLWVAYGASLGAQVIENLPTIQETWVQSLGREDPLEKGMAAHSRILAWRIPWTEEPGRLLSMGSQSVGHEPGGL